MTTEAGRRLLDAATYTEGPGKDALAGYIAAIEAEARAQGALHESLAGEGDIERARAALLAELEAGVEGLRGVWPIDRLPPPGDAYLSRAAVLDLIRKAGTP